MFRELTIFHLCNVYKESFRRLVLRYIRHLQRCELTRAFAPCGRDAHPLQVNGAPGVCRHTPACVSSSQAIACRNPHLASPFERNVSLGCIPPPTWLPDITILSSSHSSCNGSFQSLQAATMSPRPAQGAVSSHEFLVPPRLCRGSLQP